MLVYASRGCGACAKAKALLTELGVSFDVRMIDDDADEDFEVLDEMQARTVVPDHLRSFHG